MRNKYLDKAEDNASVCTWSEKIQLEKGDSVTEGHTSELWDFTRVYDFTALLDDLGSQGLVRPVSLPNFTKKLVIITGMSEQWAVARVQQKGDSKYVPWAILRDLISTHLDVKERVDVLALSIYAETLRSLSACRRASEGRFIGCAQLLLEAVDMPRRDDISEERWIDILQNLREEDVMWKALGIWGVVGYTPLLVLRQYQARQFIPATQGLAQSDFSYKGDHY
ncbi:hypothetical protein CXB51_001058 [Gossypium anomalum]|uniref:Uncharacterized protein n=1 Tax=Gossypium anomalum TaxID=47600 RepID=A0A8J5Z5K4_9ROSI|nr:hypothetical protein CXB51_001058 [Gossypium anomalum]